MRYAIVDKESGKVVNVVEWDGERGWSPPEGCEAIRSDDAQVGCTWDGSTFASAPVPEAVIDPDEELATAIKAATTLEELQAALLGKMGGAAAKGRLVDE